MSDDQQPEDLRPIPDGGLKDNMPGWLKRPPAWRSMPTAEQRHERTLPEPDSSEIDPRALVDVSDLPQWLQAIAARGEVPVPEPDQTVGHALQQLQAVSARSREAALEPTGPESDELNEPVIEDTVEEAATIEEPSGQLPETQEPDGGTASPVAQESPENESAPMPVTLVVGICVLILVVIVGAYILV